MKKNVRLFENHFDITNIILDCLDVELLDMAIDNELVHTLGVSVEIELKMEWQGCKQV